jgi:hypothetical protein
MATLTNRRIVQEIIDNHGVYQGDPQIVHIVEYENQFNGDKAWGVVYEHEDYWRYHNSPACINPTTIWEHQQ